MNKSDVMHLNTLWQQVIEEPNDVGRLQAWVEKNQECSGDFGVRSALERAAELLDSWLAKIWKTRLLLEERRLEESMALYETALKLAPKKSLAVQEIAAHLGEAGYYTEAVELLVPIYSADDHGPWAGFNLTSACEDAGDLESAMAVLDRMSDAQWTGDPHVYQLKKIVYARKQRVAFLQKRREAPNAALN